MTMIGVYGAGGCGRGIMPLLRAMNDARGARLLFIDDGTEGGQINGHAVITSDQFIADPDADKSVALAIASASVRQRLAEKCDAHALPLRSVWADQVVVMDDVVIGEGAIVSPYVTFTSNIRVGRAFHANLYSYVEHDCVIGDYVTFAPGVRCNGHVTIGDGAYIGAGAIIRHGLSIGAGATIGMGAVVVKDVPAGVTVVGNPARLFDAP